MKATTFHNRGKEKDAYDLYSIIKDYSDGSEKEVIIRDAYRRRNISWIKFLSKRENIPT